MRASDAEGCGCLGQSAKKWQCLDSYHSGTLAGRVPTPHWPYGGGVRTFPQKPQIENSESLKTYHAHEIHAQ